MRPYLLVGLGSGIGGAARYATVVAGLALFGPELMVGTLVVNVVGSGLIGVLAALARPESGVAFSPEARYLLAVGFCGGFTTYSFFGWNAVILASGSLAVGIAYVFVTTALSLWAVWYGYRVTCRVVRN